MRSLENKSALVKSALAAMPRIRIIAESDNYLHAEASSLIFRFVDDLEFLVDDAHTRSS